MKQMLFNFRKEAGKGSKGKIFEQALFSRTCKFWNDSLDFSKFLRWVLNLLGQTSFCSLSGHNLPNTVNDGSLEPPYRILRPQHWNFRYLKNYRFYAGFSIKLSDFDIIWDYNLLLIPFLTKIGTSYA